MGKAGARSCSTTLTAAVGLVLLIACVNRGEPAALRRRHGPPRGARSPSAVTLGARRVDGLIRQLLTESVLLAVHGRGLRLGSGQTRLGAIAGDVSVPAFLPRAAEIALDGRRTGLYRRGGRRRDHRTAVRASRPAIQHGHAPT